MEINNGIIIDGVLHELCVSVVIEGKQADFSFEPVTLGMFAHAYKLHCEECKAYEKRNENSQEVSRT